MTACNQSGKKDNQTDSSQTSVGTGSSMDTSLPGTDMSGVYFLNLKDGDRVKSPVIVQMGVNGMQVEPAGMVVEGKGHHHLIIDGNFVDKGTMVPKDATHLHFGNGQTSDTLNLSPGNHTLTLQFANGVHESYGKDWSKTINITVEN